MRLRSVLICAFACTVLSTGVLYADGMPGPEDDENYNPVPSPGVHPPVPPPVRAPSAAPASGPIASPPPAPAAHAPPPPPPPPTTTAQVVPPSNAPPVAAPAPAGPPPAAAPLPSATPPTATPPPAVVATTNVPPAPVAPIGSVPQKAIYEVTGIDVGLAKNSGTFVTVIVKGTSRTGGWSNAQLKPLQTFAPEVGMRSFTFVATPPAGPSTQAMTPIHATIKIDPLPADVKTIRVLSETNEIAQTFR